MKFRTISEKFEKELHQKRKSAIIIFLLCIAADGVILFFAGDGSMKQYSTVILLIMFAFFYFGLKSLGRFFGLGPQKVVAKYVNKHPYMDISESGIELETIIDGISHYNKFTWDELVEITGTKISLSPKKNSAEPYKFVAIISKNERKQIMPEGVNLHANSYWKMRKEIKKIEEANPGYDEDILYNPGRINTELTDEILAEIKKYWKGENKNIMWSNLKF